MTISAIDNDALLNCIIRDPQIIFDFVNQHQWPKFGKKEFCFSPINVEIPQAKKICLVPVTCR